MSEFSDFCNMLREKSGMTIYHIAKVSGMERTALNRMLIGKRFPKYEDVDLFCEVLRASEKEKEHLKELYLMEKMGRKKYENYRYIRKLLRDLDQDEIYILPLSQIADHEGKAPDRSFVNGKGKVKELIRYVLEQEFRQENVSGMYTNFPVHDDVLPVLMGYYEKKYGKEIPLCHFHILNVNPEEYYDVDCNLKVLYFSLMWKFSKGQSYIPYYTYSQLMLNDLELQFMPYYLVTGGQILLISNDFRQGILLNDADTVLFYHDRMIQIQNQMYMLFQSDIIVDRQLMGVQGSWERENELLHTLNHSDSERKHLNVELYEQRVVITRKEGVESLSVVITESSLYESFHDYFTYVDEMAEIVL